MSTPDTALAVRNEITFSREQVDLIKDQYMPGASDGELGLFIQVCQQRGLNPFLGQIYAIRRRAKHNGQWVDRWTYQTSIAGIRGRAERTKQRDGIEGPFWCGPDGEWTDVWLDKKPPAAAKVVVYRQGHRLPYSGIAMWDFYAQDSHMWQRGGAHMLAKCAESLAYQKAFPEECGGLYIDEEMQQSGAAPVQVTPQPSTDTAEAPVDEKPKAKPKRKSRAKKPKTTEAKAKTEHDEAKRNGYQSESGDDEIVEAEVIPINSNVPDWEAEVVELHAELSEADKAAALALLPRLQKVPEEFRAPLRDAFKEAMGR